MTALDVAVVSQGILPEFSTDTRSFVATEGYLRVELVVAIDPHSASLKFVGSLDSSTDIATEDGCCQTVDGVVGHLDELFLVVELLKNDDWAKDLLASNLGIRLDVGENGWFDKVAFVAVTRTSSEDFATLLLAGVDVSHDSVILKLADLWALECVGIPWGADLDGLVLLDELALEFIVDLGVDKDTRAGTAALSVVEVNTCESSSAGWRGKVGTSVGANSCVRP